jgi:phospholipase/carboxylesterase
VNERKARLVRFGELDAVEVPSEAKDAKTIVCFHGYGADMRDLAPLAFETPAKTPFTWLFPDAPDVLDWGGRAWWPIDVEAFEAAQRGGKPRDLSGGEPEGLAEARLAADSFLKELAVPAERLVLMGFSQGAMLAVDVAMRMKSSPAGVAVLSGTLVDAVSVKALAPARKGMPFFQSHGSVDPILGFMQALALEKELMSAGWRGKLMRFEGGHAIPGDVLAALGAWLDTL